MTPQPTPTHHATSTHPTTPQAVQAAQLTFEDFFMADMNIAPMKIVGFEGLFGIIGTLGIMAPIAYYLPGREGEGIHEDIVDTWTVRGARP